MFSSSNHRELLNGLALDKPMYINKADIPQSSYRPLFPSGICSLRHQKFDKAGKGVLDCSTLRGQKGRDLHRCILKRKGGPWQARNFSGPYHRLATFELSPRLGKAEYGKNHSLR